MGTKVLFMTTSDRLPSRPTRDGRAQSHLFCYLLFVIFYLLLKVTPLARSWYKFPPSAAGVVGVDMARHAAGKAYKEAGVQPSDVDVVELHDCFSTNELLTYEALVCVCVRACVRVCVTGPTTPVTHNSLPSPSMYLWCTMFLGPV